LHYFTVHSITWRTLPAAFGNWNIVWKRFLALSRTAPSVAGGDEQKRRIWWQMFDSTIVRAHVSAAGRKRVQETQAARQSRGGFLDNIHLKTDHDGHP